MTNRYYDGPPNNHFDGARFFNPGHPDTDRSIRDILKWKLHEKAATWPQSVPVEQIVPEPYPERLRVTMIGHATLLIQASGLNILTGPVWSNRASPVRFAGPKRATMPGVAFERLPQIHAVLLSHNHYDHLDLATLKRLHDRYRPLIIAPLGNDAIVRRHIADAPIATGATASSLAMMPSSTSSRRTTGRRARVAIGPARFTAAETGRFYEIRGVEHDPEMIVAPRACFIAGVLLNINSDLVPIATQPVDVSDADRGDDEDGVDDCLPHDAGLGDPRRRRADAARFDKGAQQVDG